MAIRPLDGATDADKRDDRNTQNKSFVTEAVFTGFAGHVRHFSPKPEGTRNIKERLTQIRFRAAIKII